MHEILPSAWKICNGSLSNSLTGFQEGCYELHTSVWEAWTLLKIVRWVLKIMFILNVYHHLKTMKIFLKKLPKNKQGLSFHDWWNFRKDRNLILASKTGSKKYLSKFVPGHEKSDWKWSKLFDRSHYRWCELVLLMWPLDQARV